MTISFFPNSLRNRKILKSIEIEKDTGIHIDNLTSSIEAIRNEMEIAASELEFEKAAYLRDRLKELEALRD